MKKLILTTATLVLLSTAAFADQNTDNANRMDAARVHRFMVMTHKMMSSEMAMLKQQEAVLSNYQRLLKQMMENDTSSKK